MAAEPWSSDRPRVAAGTRERRAAKINTWTIIFQIPSSSPMFLWLMVAVQFVVILIMLAASRSLDDASK